MRDQNTTSSQNQNSQSADQRYTTAPTPVTVPNRKDYESLTSSDPTRRAINAITGRPWLTLDEMTAERGAQLAEAQEQAQQAQEERASEVRAAAIEEMTAWLLGHVSPDLRAALRAVAACNEDRLAGLIADEWEYGNTTAELAAVALLDLAGTDLDPQATHDDHEGGRWRIERYGEWWRLCGPDDFAAHLCHINDPLGKTLDGAILDALRQYPTWRAEATQRAAGREKRRRRAQRLAPTYSALTGPHGLLTPGHRLCVRVLNPDHTDPEGLIEYNGVLIALADGWLLLDNDGGRQYAIPVARVQDIQPLAPSESDDDDGDPNAA